MSRGSLNDPMNVPLQYNDGTIVRGGECAAPLVYENGVPATFESAMQLFETALDKARKRQNSNAVVARAEKIHHMIVEIHGKPEGRSPATETKLIEHLHSTAELIKEDKPTVKQVQAYKKSAAAVHGFDGAKALKGAMYALVGALVAVAGFAIGMATAAPTLSAGFVIGGLITAGGCYAVKHGVGLFADAVRGKDDQTEQSAAILASRATR